MASVPRRREAPSASARLLDVQLLRGSLELDARHGITAAVDNGLELHVATDEWRHMICSMAAGIADDEFHRRRAA